jgi:beta-ureidopropionase / N-carbamoyl-L-amino-acid hydrolase
LGAAVPAINPERLLGDLYALRRIGTYETGVHRPTLSPDDVISRQWLVERMTEAGLDAQVDGIANVFGRSRAHGRIVLAGSHIESQNQAGWLDGALGVIFAIEAARALREDGATRDVGVDVIAFCDEEGHFGSYLGSRSFIGDVSEAEIDKARDRTRGHTMRDALKAAGYAGRPRLRFEPGRYAGYFEAHIEQGRSLEASNLKIGVVTAIVGLWDYRFKVIGRQNHAGTTTMAERRDAGLTLVRLIAAIDQEFKKATGPRSVWTCGRMEFDPGAPSIIPGEARAMFQFRDSDPAILNRLEAALHEQIAAFNKAGPCSISVETIRQSTPAVMDESFQQAIEQAAARHAPGLAVRMPSGAGHDAQHVARVMPAAMLFVPSINGVSHHWAEDTSDEDIVLGASVFTDAIASVLMRASSADGHAMSHR